MSEGLTEIGPYLHTRVPALVEGKQVFQDVCFLGVDGPRWFLRGVIAGPAAVEPEMRATMIELFRDIVVVRGQQPVPPRELLPLRVPEQAAGAQPSGS